jgi:hypothetical protein
MAQEKIKIAIVDSGVRLDHPAFVHKPPVMIPIYFLPHAQLTQSF